MDERVCNKTNSFLLQLIVIFDKIINARKMSIFYWHIYAKSFVFLIGVTFGKNVGLNINLLRIVDILSRSKGPQFSLVGSGSRVFILGRKNILCEEKKYGIF